MSEFFGFDIDLTPEAEADLKRLCVDEDPVVMGAAEPLLNGSLQNEAQHDKQLGYFCQTLHDGGYVDSKTPADLPVKLFEACRRSYESKR